MKNNIMILTALLTIAFTISGCSSSAADNKQNASTAPVNTLIESTQSPVANQDPADTRYDNSINIGGLYLGAPEEEINNILGSDYTEKVEEGFYFGEQIGIRTYGDKARIIIGKESGKLLEATVYSSDLKTDRGFKVGDSAGQVFDAYRLLYDEFIGANSDGKLEGWFVTNDNVLIIFNFNKDGSGTVRETIKPDSKVEAIILSRTQYFD